MKRSLNSREARELIGQINCIYGFSYSKKVKIEKEENIIIIDNRPSFFVHEGKIIPLLKILLENNFLKKITVDMGAVKFIAAGADVMRPGIKLFGDGIKKDDVVSIVDITHSKPLAVGIALLSS